MRNIIKKLPIIPLSLILIFLSCNKKVKEYKGDYSITNNQKILYETEDYLFMTYPPQPDSNPTIEVWFNEQTRKEGRIKHDFFRCLAEIKVHESKYNYTIFTTFKTHEQTVQIFKNCEHIE